MTTSILLDLAAASSLMVDDGASNRAVYTSAEVTARIFADFSGEFRTGFVADNLQGYMRALRGVRSIF